MMKLPKDPVMLLSAINMKLRDSYPDLNELCRDLDVDQNELVNCLRSIDYEYDSQQNQFI